MDNRSVESSGQQSLLNGNFSQVPLLQHSLIPTGSRKDCIRLRGLPYEAQVEQILEFLGDSSKNIVYQGVHMVYNAQVCDDVDDVRARTIFVEASSWIHLRGGAFVQSSGVAFVLGGPNSCACQRLTGDKSVKCVSLSPSVQTNQQGQPSGEAFIQMDSEQSAATAASQRHHKYMTCINPQSQIKKQRYIEVFQCSIDDMNLVLTGGVPVSRQLLSPAAGER